MKDDLDPVESVTASHFITSALVASPISTLVERGVLSNQDAREIYENIGVGRYTLLGEQARKRGRDLEEELRRRGITFDPIVWPE
jgi:hypothetical protein